MFEDTKALKDYLVSEVELYVGEKYKTFKEAKDAIDSWQPIKQTTKKQGLRR